jgi:hypothetical protein
MTGSKILPAEMVFWQKEIKRKSTLVVDEEIEAKYDAKTERIVTETNREKLPSFYESLKRPNYMDPRPFYQRRQRWTPEKQSQLIESFLINIPIPPLFVYETKLNVHEVMDGQQRITAIKAFYDNTLILEGLERWPELNGRTYATLPDRIKAGIDRRSISWVTVLSESSESEDDAFAIKQLVFERLNTGGVKLSPQEIRNAIYAGAFNDELIRLSRLDVHRKLWGMPKFSSVEERSLPRELSERSFYLQMEDVEVILRFFALRHADHYAGGMREFLDFYMHKARVLAKSDVVELGALYEATAQVALDIYGDLAFRPFVQTGTSDEWAWGSRQQKAYADAVLVSLSSRLERAAVLLNRRSEVLELTKQHFKKDSDGVLVGRGNTKKDVVERIRLIGEIYDIVLDA